MQDHAVVAAVVAGDADGFAAAYDQYAASLYAYCHSMLPEPDAAEAVLDTFLVAAAKLDELRDPDQLGPWLHAVAQNECLRRLGAERSEQGLDILGPADPDEEPPAATLPAGFRSRVLTACADNSPAGRAHRVSVAHRAGAFGPAGFPKPVSPSGPRWWRRVRRRPRRAVAAAAVAALALTAGITVIMTTVSPGRPQAAGAGLVAGVPGPASSTAQGHPSAPASPARTASASAQPATPPAPVSGTVSGTVSSPGPATGPGTPAPSPSPSRSPTPTPTPSTSPAQGFLAATPNHLLLTSKSGQPVSGSFLLTALNGPVSEYAIRVATFPGKVRVAPVTGSLPAGGFVHVTVTVTSTVPLATAIIVTPGKVTVTVVYKVTP